MPKIPPGHLWHSLRSGGFDTLSVDFDVFADVFDALPLLVDLLLTFALAAGFSVAVSSALSGFWLSTSASLWSPDIFMHVDGHTGSDVTRRVTTVTEPINRRDDSPRSP